MAAGSAAEDKENAPPPAASNATASAVAVAASRRPGYGVRSCGVKKPKRASRAARGLGRVPLRDITNLFEAVEAVVAGPEAPAPLGLEVEVASAGATEVAEPDAVVGVAAALRGGGRDAAGPAAKKARYSLLKGFR